MAWRVAKSLLVLRDQINARAPGRSKASDGTIGDDIHATQGSDSDHNPWYRPVGDPDGIVTALDVTHDPAHGCDIDVLSDQLAASRDPRIKYLIANSLILSGNGGPSPWTWRPYSGSDPHTNHMHVSVVADQRCDDTRPWALGGKTGGDDDMPLTIGGEPAEKYFPRIERALLWPVPTIAKDVAALKEAVAKLAATPPGSVALDAAAEARIAEQVKAAILADLQPLIDLARKIGNG